MTSLKTGARKIYKNIKTLSEAINCKKALTINQFDDIEQPNYIDFVINEDLSLNHHSSLIFPQFNNFIFTNVSKVLKTKEGSIYRAFPLGAPKSNKPIKIPAKTVADLILEHPMKHPKSYERWGLLNAFYEPLISIETSFSQILASKAGQIFNADQKDIETEEIEEILFKKRGEVLETGIKIIDFLTPIGRGNDVCVLGPQNCGKNRFLQKLSNQIQSNTDGYLSRFFLNNDPCDYHTGTEKIDMDHLGEFEEDSRISICAKKTDYSIKQVTAAKNAFFEAEQVCYKGKDGIFLYENRAGVLEAFNDLRYHKKLYPVDLFSPYQDSEMILHAETTDFTKFQRFHRRKAFPELYLERGKHKSTILSALDCHNEIISNFGYPPVLYFNQKDVLIVFKPEAQNAFSETKKRLNLINFDILRSTSRVLETPFVSEKHRELVKKTKKILSIPGKLKIVAPNGTSPPVKKRLTDFFHGEENPLLKNRVEILQNYLLTQNLMESVPLKKTLKDVEAILEGKFDNKEKRKFKFIGGLENI